MSYDAATGLSGFDVALVGMKRGERWTRRGWNGKGMWVQAMPGGLGMLGEQAFQLPMSLWLKTASGHMVPWTVSQSDALATDWEIVYSSDPT